MEQIPDLLFATGFTAHREGTQKRIAVMERSGLIKTIQVSKKECWALPNSCVVTGKMLILQVPAGISCSLKEFNRKEHRKVHLTKMRGGYGKQQATAKGLASTGSLSHRRSEWGKTEQTGCWKMVESVGVEKKPPRAMWLERNTGTAHITQAIITLTSVSWCLLISCQSQKTRETRWWGPLRSAGQGKEPGKAAWGMIWKSKGMNSSIFGPHFLLCLTGIIIWSYPPHRILVRIACKRSCEYTVEISNLLQVLRWWGTSCALCGVLYWCPHPGQGRPPTPNQRQNVVNRAAQGSAGGREGGSCTLKEIIETGLFMLVGKGAWIWIKPCVHFANYPASVLKEKRAHCRFSSQFHPVEPAPTYVHTHTNHRSHHHRHHHFLSSHVRDRQGSPEYEPHGPIGAKYKLTEDSNPASYQGDQGRNSHPVILVGRNFFPTISRVKATSYSSIGKDLRSLKEGEDDEETRLTLRWRTLLQEAKIMNQPNKQNPTF